MVRTQHPLHSLLLAVMIVSSSHYFPTCMSSDVVVGGKESYDHLEEKDNSHIIDGEGQDSIHPIVDKADGKPDIPLLVDEETSASTSASAPHQKKNRQKPKHVRGDQDAIRIVDGGVISKAFAVERRDQELPVMEEIMPMEEEYPQEPLHKIQKERLDEEASWQQGMLNLINLERDNVLGAGPLCFNSKLNAAALAHSNDMVSNDFFSHTGSDGSSAGDRITRANYNWNAYAENIAINSSYEGAHTSFMNSSGHRANILRPNYQHIGIARVTQTSEDSNWDGYEYYTQVFGRGSVESCSEGNGGDGDNGDGGGDDEEPVCTDSPTNWYDSDGPIYNCQWYSRGRRCRRYGDYFENLGKTAKQACCACGGGVP